MKMLKRWLAAFIESSAKHMAIASAGSASHWGTFQPKEPKNIYKK